MPLNVGPNLHFWGWFSELPGMGGAAGSNNVCIDFTYRTDSTGSVFNSIRRADRSKFQIFRIIGRE
jgi:hypothetical protein